MTTVSDAGTVEVRIRHEEDVKSAPFTRWPIGDLDALLSQIKHWGVICPYGDFPDPSGQWVYQEGGFFFEVVLNDPDQS